MTLFNRGTKEKNWANILLDNGMTAGGYAQVLRGSDPRNPLRTHNQIRDFLAECGITLSENQVRNHFRRVGQTAPYPGQATDATRFVKGDLAPQHPYAAAHPELCAPLAPETGELRAVQAPIGAEFIEHGTSSIGIGTIGGDLITATLNADGSTTLASSSGGSVTAHLDGSVGGIGSVAHGEALLAGIPKVLGDDYLSVHKTRGPSIVPVAGTGETKSIGQVLSEYQAELAEEFDPKRDGAVVEQLVDDERKKIAARRETRLRDQWIKRQALITEFVEGVKEAIEPIEYEPYEPHFYEAGIKGNQAAVLYISDAHIGKLTATFNIEVIKDRLGQIVNYVRESVRRQRLSRRVDELHILLGGDICDGANIFPTQTYHSEQNIKNQIFRSGVPYFAELVRDLATDFARVVIATVPGNHGRQGKFAHEEDNADNYFYHALALACVNLENVEWDLCTHWYNIHDVLGTSFLMVHGHQHMSQQGVPYYSITRMAMKWEQTMPSPFVVEIMGHFHTPAELDVSGIDVIMNGSMVTGDEYALEKMGAQSAPVQTFLFVDEEHGLVERQLIHLH